MSVSELSSSTQDYLKAVWSISEWTDEPVTPKQIAEKLGLRMSSVSDAVRKLSSQGLLTHVPYGEVKLTPQGRAHAVAMVRRHRLIEMFLVEVLGYAWDEVHDEAEHLEHAVSDLMVDRVDALLGHPERDPHGDPIPSASGVVEAPRAVRLSELTSPVVVTVERIADESPELLQYLEDQEITVGTKVRVEPGPPFSGVTHVEVLDGAAKPVLALGADAAKEVYVSAPGTPGD